MEGLRLATQEEVETIKKKANLTENSTVVAYPSKEGTDFAVLRTVLEVDPVIFAKPEDTRRNALFVWALENHMRLSGVLEYYFNVLCKDETWIKNVEKWGAEATSTGPELRFKKRL